jgi:hypothetical protein
MVPEFLEQFPPPPVEREEFFTSQSYCYNSPPVSIYFSLFDDTFSVPQTILRRMNGRYMKDALESMQKEVVVA